MEMRVCERGVGAVVGPASSGEACRMGRGQSQQRASNHVTGAGDPEENPHTPFPRHTCSLVFAITPLHVTEPLDYELNYFINDHIN